MQPSTVSPNPFTTVTCAQSETALICEKHKTASGGLANSDILQQMPVRVQGGPSEGRQALSLRVVSFLPL